MVGNGLWRSEGLSTLHPWILCHDGQDHILTSHCSLKPEPQLKTPNDGLSNRGGPNSVSLFSSQWSHIGYISLFSFSLGFV